MKFGKLQPQGKVEFDGYQELMNWTSAGSESSVSLSVDGDTDMEYVIECRNKTNQVILILLNGDTADTYGYQGIQNVSGTIIAGRNVLTALVFCRELGYSTYKLSTIDGFTKFALYNSCKYTSGTTIGDIFLQGQVYPEVDNITTIRFFSGSGNFTAGTNIRVLGRRAR